MEDLLSSLTTTLNRTFIIASDGQIYKEEKGKGDFNLYSRLFFKNQRTIPRPTDIWINRVPCPDCVNLLLGAFPSETKPTIYLETFVFNETNFENLMLDMSCMAKIQSSGFPVKSWDWDMFKTYITETGSVNCLNTIVTNTSDPVYSTKKANFEKLLTMIQELQDENSISEWC